MTVPLRRGGGGKGRTIIEKKILFPMAKVSSAIKENNFFAASLNEPPTVSLD